MVNLREIAGERKKKQTTNKKNPARLIGTIDFYHFIPLSLTLTLPGGHKVSAKQNLLASMCTFYYLLTYAHRSQWSIGHQRPPAFVLCSGLLLLFRTSWSPAVSALLQCLASNCCEAGLSSSSLVGSRSGLGVWCWMLAS